VFRASKKNPEQSARRREHRRDGTPPETETSRKQADPLAGCATPPAPKFRHACSRRLRLSEAASFPAWRNRTGRWQRFLSDSVRSLTSPVRHRS
jgi:hypothetical protein